MGPADVVVMVRSALLVTLIISGPLLMAALVVGFVIGLLQAVTQIQEPTLTFVPKLFAMGGVLLLTLPLIGNAMSRFMAEIVQQIVAR